MLKFVHNRMNLWLALLLAVLAARLWVRQMGSSYWADEMVTVFVVHHTGDPSLAVAPQVPKSIYYAVAGAAARIFGTSEIGYRVMSILFSLAAIFFVSRLAARLIHPQAAWFAVFACFGMKGFNWEAPDARPYAMGLCVVAAAMLFLVRWLDSAAWRDAVFFVILAALLWRIQLIFWPAYAILALYSIVRLGRRETPVTWPRAGIVFVSLAILLLPVAREAIELNRQAQAHVIAEQPALSQLLNAIQWRMMIECAAAAFIFSRLVGPKSERSRPRPATSLILVGGWWLIPPFALFLYSQITGHSVFVRRYYSISLPGAALAATCLASYFIPKRHWKSAAVLFAIAVLAWYGVRPEPWPGSDWRGAASAVNALPAATPVIAPSPFIEAKGPDWRPDYPLPGFLYAHLSVYRLERRPLLFPFHGSAEAETYATQLIPTLEASRQFAIYGGDQIVRFWRGWYLAHPEFSKWKARSLGRFGDVEAVVVTAP